MAAPAHIVQALGTGPLERWLAPSSQSRVERIPVVNILARPIADHDEGDAASFRALMTSMKARGIVEPLLLRPATGGSFMVVCGARRLRAARRLGFTAVPCIVRELGDVEMFLTGAWQALLRFGISHDDAPALERRLISGGLQPAEAAALVAAIPLRDAAAGWNPVDATGSRTIPCELRFLRPGAQRARERDCRGPIVPPLPGPAGLLLPVAAATVGLLAQVQLPSRPRHMAA